MIAGCGNSNLAGDMVKDGYTKVVCGDISRVFVVVVVVVVVVVIN